MNFNLFVKNSNSHTLLIDILHFVKSNQLYVRIYAHPWIFKAKSCMHNYFFQDYYLISYEFKFSSESNRNLCCFV